MNAPFTVAQLNALLRTDFRSFLQKVFGTLNPGRKFKDNWHIGAIVRKLDRVHTGKVTRLVINMPPRSLKSMIVSIAYPAYLLGLDPTRRIICVSYSQKLAEALARDFRNVVNSAWYQSAFPSMRAGKDTAEEFVTTKAGFRLATSIGGTLTGRGGDIIIIDDPLAAEGAMSAAERDQTNDFYRSTILSRLDDKASGILIIVMQRLHDEDLTGTVLREGGWEHLKLPAIAIQEEAIAISDDRDHIRKPGEVLHPEHESRETLEKLRRAKGSASFQAQYQQSPVLEGGNLIKSEWLRRYRDYPPQRFSTDKVVQSWDTANKGREHNDYSVCTTWYERKEHTLLADLVRRQCDYPALLRLVVDEHRRHRPDALLVEDHGSGTALIQDLKQTYGIAAIPILPEGDKLTRLSIVSPQFEAGSVLLPIDAPFMGELLDELARFPQTRFNDQVDSVSQYLWWRRRQQSKTEFEADWGWDEP